jgi:hypothetical protein
MIRCLSLLAFLFCVLAAARAAPATAEVEQLQVLLKDIQPPLQVTEAGGRVIVTGRITTQAGKLTFERAMEQFPEAMDIVNVEVPEPLVGINALFIEVEAGSGHDIVLLDPDDVWDNLDAQGGGVGDKQVETHYPTDWDVSLDWRVSASARLLRSIRALVDKGKAKIIARPRIVVQNGEQAKLLSGGEIPYSTSNWRGTNTEFKPFGIRLDVTPELLSSGEVKMDLVVESSEPGSGGSITARRATTRVTVGNGKSLLVAGLTSTASASNHGFGCLFPLFKSTSSYRKTELLVLVTPEVPPAEGLGDLKMIQPGDLQK